MPCGTGDAFEEEEEERSNGVLRMSWAMDDAFEEEEEERSSAVLALATAINEALEEEEEDRSNGVLGLATPRLVVGVRERERILDVLDWRLEGDAGENSA